MSESKPTDRESIFNAALSLPEMQRSQLANQLIASLSPPQKLTDAEWCEEILRRCTQIETGEAETVSGEKAMEMLRAALDRRELT